MTKVAVIGTGNVGGNLGATLSRAGWPVKFGMKDPTKDTKDLLAKCKDATTADVPSAVAWADVVFLAVPGSAAVSVAASLAKELEGTIVVDCNNALTWKEGPVWNPPPEGSLSAAIAKAAPGAKVVKAFNTFGAEFHADPRHAGVPAQVYIAADDAAAKSTVTELATKAGYRVVDAGPGRNAAVLENLAILWIHLAMVGGKGRDFTFVMAEKGK
jgi:NADPH-dependent F420 reductase